MAACHHCGIADLRKNVVEFRANFENSINEGRSKKKVKLMFEKIIELSL